MVPARFPSVSVVIPSIREEAINDFLRAWGLDEKQENVEVIVVEDNDRKTFLLPSHVLHYSRDDFQEFQDQPLSLFSQKNSAIRCFGFLKATKDFIITLDDDCYPVGTFTEFANAHWQNLTVQQRTQRWETSVGYPTRGMPYLHDTSLVTTILSHGGWENVPDFDAPQQLLSMRANIPSGVPSVSRILPLYQYYPMCGMNIAFRREVRGVMYFPKMGFGQPYDRLEDIWAGVLSKRVFDLHNRHVISGNPAIVHTRLSNVFKNLEAEAKGFSVNEIFWKVVDGFYRSNVGESIFSTYEQLGKYLSASESFDSIDFSGLAVTPESKKVFLAYLQDLGEAMQRWSTICRNLP